MGFHEQIGMRGMDSSSSGPTCTAPVFNACLCSFAHARTRLRMRMHMSIVRCCDGHILIFYINNFAQDDQIHRYMRYEPKMFLFELFNMARMAAFVILKTFIFDPEFWEYQVLVSCSFLLTLAKGPM